MDEEELDVAIVGAGMSGLWCGWRLTAGDPGAGGDGDTAPRSVAVFELADRVGGRLLSVRMPGLPDVACELGGMRYMSTQPLVRWLVEEVLHLEGMDAPVAQPENLAYLRGQRLHVRDLGDGADLPYDLTDDERTHPDELLGRAIDAMAPAAKGTFGDRLREAAQAATYAGRPLYDQGFWNILARELSGEAFRYTRDAGGYDTTELNWNAADTVVLNADFDPATKYTRLVEGYEAVPQALAQRFLAQGGALHLHHGVRSLDTAELADGTQGVSLVVEDTRTGEVRTVRARSVVLAMPRRSLELLSPTGALSGDPHFQDLVRTVTPIPLFKAFVAYHRPWWKDVGISAGRSVTDLPLRQVYYWHTAEDDGASVLLATYTDTSNVGFWQGLAGDPEHYGLRVDHLPDEHRDTVADVVVDDAWMAQKAPKALVDEIHRQLVEMHGVDDAPAPYAAVFHDWVDDPFGGGVNFWNIGVQSPQVIAEMVQPVPGVPAHVCGEAYSDAQGWVEGALRTAELLLTQRFGLDPVPAPADAEA